MNTKKVIQSSFRILRRNKLRTFFMTLGIIIGCLALMISMAMGEGSKQKMMDTVSKMFSPNSIMLVTGGGGMMGGGETNKPIKLEDAEYLEANVDNIEVWDPMLTTSADIVFEGNNTTTTIFAHSEKGEQVWNRGVVEGEYFSREDVESSARVALVGSKVVNTIFEGANPIGSQLRINNIPFIVKGVLADEGVDAHGIDKDEDLYVPISTMQRRIMNIDYVRGIQFIVKDRAKMQQTADDIAAVIREDHALAAGEEDDFTIITPVQIEQMIDSMNRTFSVFLPLIAMIAAIVGGIVIAVLMLISIKERKHEIGLRKAVGASSKNIFHQFLWESVTVAFTGAIIAVVLAVILILLASRGMPFILSPLSLVLSIVVPVIIGIVAGVVPARKAAQLDPIENLT